MNVKFDLYSFLLLLSTIFIVGCVEKDVDPEYFCENPDHLDGSVLQNIHKCYCEPYNPADMEGKPSIVRFPVTTFIFKIEFQSSLIKIV